MLYLTESSIVAHSENTHQVEHQAYGRPVILVTVGGEDRPFSIAPQLARWRPLGII
jgi:hypothetical protein